MKYPHTPYQAPVYIPVPTSRKERDYVETCQPPDKDGKTVCTVKHIDEPWTTGNTIIVCLMLALIVGPLVWIWRDSRKSRW